MKIKRVVIKCVVRFCPARARTVLTTDAGPQKFDFPDLWITDVFVDGLPLTHVVSNVRPEPPDGTTPMRAGSTCLGESATFDFLQGTTDAATAYFNTAADTITWKGHVEWWGNNGRYADATKFLPTTFSNAMGVAVSGSVVSGPLSEYELVFV